MHRRTFLKTAPAIATLPAFAADAQIDLFPENPGPTISPHIYGHFIEHLGGVIYDGIWVGRKSKIANVDGIRKSFIDDMKRIGAPNLRWPGGCFADGYHWRDGIGSNRRRTYNYWQAQSPPGVDHTEPNEFGIHEFMRLCRLTGAEPYVAANVGSGSPQEFYDWVSYCNAPPGTVTLANERAANGDKDPFKVTWWGVGNESWGCGGQMHPREYATLYRLYTAQIPAYHKPFLVACGPRGHSADSDLGWTTGFFDGLKGVRGALPDGFALHYYTDFRPTRVRAEASTAAEWYAVLHSGARLEQILDNHWAEMGKFDPQHRTRFVVDEWGTWYNPESRRLAPRYLLSQIMTMRDAIHAAMTFDIFNRHADKVAMANIAQTVNCLHSLFLAMEDKHVRTPVYHVFDMYRPHMGARRVPVKMNLDQIDAPVLQGTAKLRSIDGSASIKGRVLTLTLTNPSVDAASNVRITLHGASPVEGRGTLLTAAIDAANTFDRPDTVRPSPVKLQVASGGTSGFALPPRSIAALEFRLA